MADQKALYREDGSYNFKQREDWGYAHNYSYMAGWLGQDEAEKEKKRKKKLGTTDMAAPPIPTELPLVETIEKTARYVHQSNDPAVFERIVAEKNKGKPGWAFIQEDGAGNDYYKFVRHCLEREVDPRPLAQQARKVMEDREKKQAHVANNVFVAGSGAGEEKKVKKEQVFKCGEMMEVLGIKNKPDYNGKIVRVLKYHPDLDRYEVRFEGGRYNTVVVKLREENLMYSAVAERDKEEDEMLEGEIPNGTRIEIRGLQSEAAKWMNGQKAIIVQWDKETERYEVRLDINNDIKKVKPANVRGELPEGWEEHWDEHLSRHYYMNTKTQKVTWKHPTVANQRGKMGLVRENNADELQEVEIDVNRKQYEVDEEEEGEGGFDLQQLVKKVEEQEEKREAAEEAGEDVDSDDGMHRVKKKAKKKHEKVTPEILQEKVIRLIEETMVARETIVKDFTLLEGHWVARELDPYLKKWEAYDLDEGVEPPPTLLKATFETMLALLQKGCALMTQLSRSRLQLVETNKMVDKIIALQTPKELLEAAKWVSGLLKTM